MSLLITNTNKFLLIAMVLFALSQQSGLAQKKATTKVPDQNGPEVIEKHKVGLLAKAFGDSVIVRWAPDRPDLFRAGLRSGYLLTRKSFNDDDSQKIDFQLLIKPWPVDVWLKNVSRNDTLAAACAQLVNGKNTPLRHDEQLTLDKIMHQQNQTDLRMTMSLVLADVKPVYAQGMALGYVDKTVKKGKRYAYFLKPMADPELFKTEVAATYLINEKDMTPDQMPPVKATSGEHSVELSWERALAENTFSSYFFERSDNGGKTFRRLASTPWFQPMEQSKVPGITFGDSLTDNYRTYHYRVLGITPFGEIVASETVSGMGIDLTAPPSVTHMDAKYVGKSQVRVSWKYDNKLADLAGFVVGKSTSMEGPFTPVHPQLLGADARELLDTTSTVSSSYYKIVAVDTARNLGMGLPVFCIVRDKSGPTKPTGLKGYIDSTGFTRIVWEVNAEADLLGYKVLAANAPDHVFIAVTPGYLAIAGFNDSTGLNTLTRHKYFRVVAYDKNYNPSEPSEILTLTRPDMVRPVAPTISEYFISDSAVTFRWSPSVSTDVKQQILMRRGKSTEYWREMARLNNNVMMYADTTTKGESDYDYALVAVDSSGLKSDPSFPLHVKTPKRTPPAIKKLRATQNPDQTITVSWDYPLSNCRFTIFRAAEGRGYESVDAVYDRREYRDKRPEKGSVRYAVRVMFQDGSTSRLSDTIELTVK